MQKLATLTANFDSLTSTLRDCQSQPDVSFQEIGENLSKVLRQGLLDQPGSADQFPETVRLVRELRGQFVSSGAVQGKVDEAAQVIKDEIMGKVQAEVGCRLTEKNQLFFAYHFIAAHTYPGVHAEMDYLVIDP